MQFENTADFCCSIRWTHLRIASLFYLAAPLLIFMAGWFRWYWGIAFCAAVIMGFVATVRHPPLEDRDQNTTIQIRPSFVFLVLVAALALLGLSGIGGLGYQESDWVKHNAILGSLIQKTWPVTFSIEGQATPLTYYISYYLPSALVGKALGWTAANLFLWAWSLFGLGLAMTWFLVLVGRQRLWVLLLFVFFSGLDLVGWLLTKVVGFQHCGFGHIEWWAHPWQYSAFLSSIFWAPQHAFVGWILSALFIHHILTSTGRGSLLFVWSLSVMASPFVAVGLAPFLLADFFLREGPMRERIATYLRIPNFMAVALLAVQGLYFLSKLQYSGPLLPKGPILQGLIFTVLGDRSIALVLAGMVLFCFLEFGLVAGICFLSGVWDTKAKKTLAIASVATLSLLPFYKFGMFNDLVMRASIPALFFLAVFAGKVLSDSRVRRGLRIALIIVLVIGSATVLIEINRHARHVAQSGRWFDLLSPDQVPDMFEANAYYSKDRPPQDWWLPQYLGNPESAFFKYLAKRQ